MLHQTEFFIPKLMIKSYVYYCPHSSVRPSFWIEAKIVVSWLCFNVVLASWLHGRELTSSWSDIITSSWSEEASRGFKWSGAQNDWKLGLCWQHYSGMRHRFCANCAESVPVTSVGTLQPRWWRHRTWGNRSLWFMSELPSKMLYLVEECLHIQH